MKYAMIICGDGMYIANTNNSGTLVYVSEIKANTSGLACYAGSGTTIVIKNNTQIGKPYCFKEL